MKKKLKKPTLEKIPAGWFDRESLARAFDVTEAQVDRKYRDLAGLDGQRSINGRPYTRLRSVIDGMVLAEVQKQRAADVDDPLMDVPGGSSPALERYRQARAGSAELDLCERQRQLISVSELEPAFSLYASVIRQAGQTLQTEFGPKAAVVLNEFIDQAVAGIERFLAESGNQSPAMAGGK